MPYKNLQYIVDAKTDWLTPELIKKQFEGVNLPNGYSDFDDDTKAKISAYMEEQADMMYKLLRRAVGFYYEENDRLQLGFKDIDELIQFTETDPIFTASAAAGITSGMISQWNTAYGWGNHASAGYVTAISIATANGISGSSSGGATPTLTLTLGAITPSSVNGVSSTEIGYVSGVTSNIQNQINNINSGLSWKAAARVLSASNVTLSAPGSTIDGVAMSIGDRFLANGQSTGSENGVYVWNGSAVPATRSTDASTGGSGSTGVLGMTISIEEGTYADQMWICTTNAPITIGVTTLNYAKSSATTYTSSNGITLTGNNFTLDYTYSGTFTNATWNGGVVAGQYGGTGIANTGKTFTLGASLVTTGTLTPTFAFPTGGSATYTFPLVTSTLLAHNLGLSGGTTLVGDTASGGNLTLSSTSNATKGSILFGTSRYDEANNRLGLGMTPTYRADFTQAAVDGTTSTYRTLNVTLSGSQPTNALTLYGAYITNSVVSQNGDSRVGLRAETIDTGGSGAAIGIYGRAIGSGTNYGGYFEAHGNSTANRAHIAIYGFTGNYNATNSTAIGGKFQVNKTVTSGSFSAGILINHNDDTNDITYEYLINGQYKGTTVWNVRSNGFTFIGGATKPTAWLHLAAGTSSISQFNLTAGALNSSTANGDMTHVSTNNRLTFRTGSVTYDVPLSDGTTTAGTTASGTIRLRINGTNYDVLKV